MTKPAGPNFIQRQTDPATALGEVLFGHMMVLKLAPGESVALGMIRQMMEPLAARAARDDFYPRISVQLCDAQPLETRIPPDDFGGTLAGSLLMVLSCFPAPMSFLVMQDPQNARQASRGTLSVKLFGVGWRWSCLTDANEPIVGLALMLLSALRLVGVAILLRG